MKERRPYKRPPFFLPYCFFCLAAYDMVYYVVVCKNKSAPVAQWIECRPPEPKVGRSNRPRRASY